MRILLLLLLTAFSAFAQKVPLYNTNTLYFYPSNILASNFSAGANLLITKGASGQLTLALPGTIGIPTNVNGGFSIITNTISVGTIGVATNVNANNIIATNSIQGIGTGVNGVDNLVVTNWLKVSGPQTNASTLQVAGGGSSTNAWVGGTIYVLNQGFTNKLGDAALTNAASLVVPAGMLTNLYDQVEVNISGAAQSSTATTNQLKVTYGSETVFDSGLLGLSNSAWRAQIYISRTGNSNQIAQATVWGFTPSGITNFTTGLLQTNGVATTLQVQLASRKPGGVTNDFINAKYWPAPR